MQKKSDKDATRITALSPSAASRRRLSMSVFEAARASAVYAGRSSGVVRRISGRKRQSVHFCGMPTPCACMQREVLCAVTVNNAMQATSDAGNAFCIGCVDNKSADSVVQPSVVRIKPGEQYAGRGWRSVQMLSLPAGHECSLFIFAQFVLHLHSVLIQLLYH